MMNAGVKQAAILSVLSMTDGKNFANLRTICNARFTMHIYHLAGRSHMDALLKNLQESNWLYHFEANYFGKWPVNLRIARV